MTVFAPWFGTKRFVESTAIEPCSLTPLVIVATGALEFENGGEYSTTEFGVELRFATKRLPRPSSASEFGVLSPFEIVVGTPA